MNIDPRDASQIRRIVNEYPGIDVLHLNDGTIITINEESIVLRAHESDFYNDAGDEREIGHLDRPELSPLPLPRRYHEDDIADLTQAWRAVARVASAFDAIPAANRDPKQHEAAAILHKVGAWLDALQRVYESGN